MAVKKKILFIINPISGTKKKVQFDELISTHLDSSLYTPTLYTTTGRGDAIRRSERAVKEGFDTVVAVGGDGTINEVAQGLVNTAVKLAVIPRGSGNGFANYFGIPHDPAGALAVINQAQTKTIDTGRFNDKLFLSVAGLGFDARVSMAFDTFGKRGLWSYVYIALREYFTYTPKTYTLQLNGKSIRRKAFLLTIANSTQFGNNAHIAPQAKIDDGLFDVVVLKPAGVFGAMSVALRMFRGTLHLSRYSEIYQTDKLEILHKDDEVQIDGEPASATPPATVQLQPASLHMVC